MSWRPMTKATSTQRATAEDGQQAQDEDGGGPMRLQSHAADAHAGPGREGRRVSARGRRREAPCSRRRVRPGCRRVAGGRRERPGRWRWRERARRWGRRGRAGCGRRRNGYYRRPGSWGRRAAGPPAARRVAPRLLRPRRRAWKVRAGRPGCGLNAPPTGSSGSCGGWVTAPPSTVNSCNLPSGGPPGGRPARDTAQGHSRVGRPVTGLTTAPRGHSGLWVTRSMASSTRPSRSGSRSA